MITPEIINDHFVICDNIRNCYDSLPFYLFFNELYFYPQKSLQNQHMHVIKTWTSLRGRVSIEWYGGHSSLTLSSMVENTKYGLEICYGVLELNYRLKFERKTCLEKILTSKSFVSTKLKSYVNNNILNIIGIQSTIVHWCLLIYYQN